MRNLLFVRQGIWMVVEPQDPPDYLNRMGHSSNIRQIAHVSCRFYIYALVNLEIPTSTFTVGSFLNRKIFWFESASSPIAINVLSPIPVSAFARLRARSTLASTTNIFARARSAVIQNENRKPLQPILDHRPVCLQTT